MEIYPVYASNQGQPGKRRTTISLGGETRIIYQRTPRIVPKIF